MPRAQCLVTSSRATGSHVPKSPQMRVLIAGSITRDLIVIESEDGCRQTSAPGGTAFHAAHTYARLGATVRVVSRIASEDRDWIRSRMPPRVELDLQAGRRTTSFENRYRGDMRAQRVTAIASPIECSEACVRDVDWIHLGPLHAHDLDQEWFSVQSAPLALDVQGLVRRIDQERVTAAAAPGVGNALAGIGWLKAGADEWRTLLDALALSGPELLAQLPVIEVLHTEGRAGGAVLRHEGETVRWSPMPLVENRDTTGAGDAFFAAYLFHRVGQGEPPSVAAVAAATWASRFLSEREQA